MRDYYLGYLKFTSHQFGEIGDGVKVLIKHTLKMIGDSLHILFLGNNHFNQHLSDRGVDLILKKNVFQLIKIIEELNHMGDWKNLDDELKNLIMERFDITKQYEIKYLHKTIKYLKGLDSILIRKNGIS